MLARVALVVAAIAIGGWLAFSLRAIRLEADARALLPDPPARPAPAVVDEAVRLLDRAQEGNPDVRPKLVEASLLGIAGRNREAAALCAEVLREEPDNLRAAMGLYANLRVYDRAGAAAAARRVREIAPPVAR